MNYLAPQAYVSIPRVGIPFVIILGAIIRQVRRLSVTPRKDAAVSSDMKNDTSDAIYEGLIASDPFHTLYLIFSCFHLDVQLRIDTTGSIIRTPNSTTPDS